MDSSRTRINYRDARYIFENLSNAIVNPRMGSVSRTKNRESLYSVTIYGVDEEGDLVLKLERSEDLSRYLLVDVENLANVPTEVLIVIATECDEKLSVLRLVEKPKTHSKYVTVKEWDWTEPVIKMVVMFKTLENLESCMKWYPKQKNVIFRTIDPLSVTSTNGD